VATTKYVLLFFVNGDVLEPLTVWIGSAHNDGAAFAIGRNHDPSAANKSSVVHGVEFRGPIILLLVRATVRSRITNDGIVSAIKSARPHAARGLAFRIYAIRRYLYFVTGSFIDNRGVLSSSGFDLRFCFVQLPRSHLWIGCETRGPSEKAKRYDESKSFCFHVLHRDRSFVCGQFFSEVESLTSGFEDFGRASAI